jgi:succinoglycan biosynthesis protein ExoM
MSNQADHISVCICTFKRPGMLKRAIECVISQITNEFFTIEIIVVDNDRYRTAECVVKTFQKKSDVNIEYDNLPLPNISMARNRCTQKAKGSFIAFIDDDEFPDPTWLIRLYHASMKYSAEGVLGPVHPSFEGVPPEWLVKSQLCVRSSFPTGTLLRDSKYMRTGNVLFHRKILAHNDEPFDPKLGRTGGEDADFFSRMIKKGWSFIWCDEAIVHETVPIERQKVKYFVQRAFIRGVTSADQQPLIGFGTLKSILAVFTYTLSLPFLFISGRHLFMRYFIKTCDHIAKLLAHFGVKLVRERMF